MGVVSDLLIDFVYPRKCVICGKLGVSLCIDCLKEFEYSEQICPMCGEISLMGWTHKECEKRNALDGLITIYDYQDERVKKFIKRVKFEFNRDLIEIVLSKCEIELGMEFDMVVPIPLYFYRYNWRGFNQAEIMASFIGKMINTPINCSLVRYKPTKQQSITESVDNRINNIKGVFKLSEESQISGKRILLVDDVYTSGATMKEACSVLKKGGAEIVWGLCLAH